MDKKNLSIFLAGFPLILLDINGWHMMDWDHHMMDWWGIPFIGFWWIGVWIAQFVIAFLVYKDAEKRENNGWLWFVLVILPWIGIIFLIIYSIIREEKTKIMETSSDAKRILDERYAKGEMTRKEYLQAKEDIEKKN
ncbi:MAG: SHOCT domain-containing protein [Candidatus Hodarchaeales archaeon]|jgi:putative membrane protein